MYQITLLTIGRNIVHNFQLHLVTNQLHEFNIVKIMKISSQITFKYFYASLAVLDSIRRSHLSGQIDAPYTAESTAHYRSQTHRNRFKNNKIGSRPKS